MKRQVYVIEGRRYPSQKLWRVRESAVGLAYARKLLKWHRASYAGEARITTYVPKGET